MLRQMLAVLIGMLVAYGVNAQGVCEALPGKQVYPPLKMQGGTVCFVVESVELGELEHITLYFRASGRKDFMKGPGLMHDSTPGKIESAFAARLGGRESLFVVYSLEVRASLVEPNSSGHFYMVDVFTHSEGDLSRDNRASHWFGSGYSFIDDGGEYAYRFPYVTKARVLAAFRSPFARLMLEPARISVAVKRKSYLFDSPYINSRTDGYLNKGDRAGVVDVTGGWCEIQYAGQAVGTERWLPCKELLSLEKK